MEVEMDILLAVAWAGAGSWRVTTSGELWHLAIALVLTGGVAWLAEASQRARIRHHLEEQAAADPVAGVH